MEISRDIKTCRMLAVHIVCIIDSLNQGDIEELIWLLTEPDYTPYNDYSEEDLDNYYQKSVEEFGEKYSNLQDLEVVRKCLHMLATVNSEDPWVLEQSKDS